MDRGKQTKEGIARVREQGKSWGKGGKIQGKRNKAKADEFAQSLQNLLFDLMINHKCNNAGELAMELNRREIPSAKGGTWNRRTVRRVLDRYDSEFKTNLVAAGANGWIRRLMKIS